MIDYISIELDASMKDVLFNNDLLDFVSDVSNKTGELNPNNSTFIQSAQYNGLTFYIVQYKNMMTKPKVSLKGSIHKYWQHGTNYMDFNFESLKQATNQLQDLFNIDWNITPTSSSFSKIPARSTSLSFFSEISITRDNLSK
jgi:hypothetical protein